MFTPRLTIPGKSNKFYIEQRLGGLNPGVSGPPTVRFERFRNCVFYALGRFAELWGFWLKSVNAEYFVEVAQNMGLRIMSKPTEGAIACWEGIGKAAGHVAVVEVVNENGSIVTSESGWSASKDFWTQTRKNDGNWGQDKKKYRFKGFIYPPYQAEDYVSKFPVLKKGDVRGEVRLLQQRLTKLGYYASEIDGSFGKLTFGAVLAFQMEHELDVDGVCGPKTWARLQG